MFPDKITTLSQRCEATPEAARNQLYTADTCAQFHWLLCTLLRSFQGQLERLLSSATHHDFCEILGSVAFFGRSLRILARSGAVESHLKAIEPKLLLNGGKGRGRADEEEQDPDIELQSVQPSASKNSLKIPLWQSYKDWLTLMIAHLDAAGMLHKYVTGEHFPFQGVAINVIPPPFVTDALLPWEDLLQSPHFPQSGHSVLNEDIIMFLRKGVLAKNVIKDFEAFLTSKVVNSSGRQLAPIIPKLKEYENDTEIAKIITQVETWIKSDKLSRDVVAGSDALGMLKTWIPDSVFFDVLDNMRNGKGFKGVEHCEALLAVIITHHQNPEFGTLPEKLAMFQVRHVCLSLSSASLRYFYDVGCGTCHRRFQAMLPGLCLPT